MLEIKPKPMPPVVGTTDKIVVVKDANGQPKALKFNLNTAHEGMKMSTSIEVTLEDRVYRELLEQLQTHR